MFTAFLIKYAEIGVKGKNRYIFEDALMNQIRFALQPVEGSFHVHRSQGRIYVECDGYYDYDETVEQARDEQSQKARPDLKTLAGDVEGCFRGGPADGGGSRAQ